MNLNGWQRLWIVTILLYGIGVALYTVKTTPKVYSIEGIKQHWVLTATVTMAQIAAIGSGEARDIDGFVDRLYEEKSPDEIITWIEQIAESPTKDEKIFQKQLSRINTNFKSELATLPKRQRTHFSVAFVTLWLIPSIALYLLGWVLGWIIRGFKKESE